jgi:hypothetical protein
MVRSMKIHRAWQHLRSNLYEGGLSGDEDLDS